MASNSKKFRINKMIDALEKALTGDDDVVMDLSPKNDELDTLAAIINKLLKKAGKPLPFPITEETKSDASGVREDHYQLRSREERYRHILDSIEEFYFEVDLKGNLLFFNDNMVRVLNYTPEEIKNKNFRMFVDPYNAKIIFETFHQVYLTGETIKGFDWVVNKKNRGRMDLESSVALLRDENGRPCGFRGIVRDISQRKQTERHLHLITENIHEFIFTIDFDLNFTYISPSVFPLTGFTPEEIMTTPMENFLPLAQQGLISQTLVDKTHEAKNNPFKVKGPPEVFEMELMRKDGSRFWAEISAIFNRDENGKLFEILGVTRDISERKKAEDAFRESEKRYRLLVENMNDVICILDFNLQFIYLSNTNLKLTGYTKEEIKNIHIDKLLTPESLNRVTKILAKELVREESEAKPDAPVIKIMEVELLHKEGKTTWAELVATFNRDENGKAKEILLTAKDITDRKKIEEALRESEKRYRMIVENMKDTITILDLNLEHLYQSPSEIRVTGYTPEEIKEIPTEKRATPESYALAIQILTEELAKEYSGQPVDPQHSRTLEMELYCKDGSMVWLEITASFNRDETGKPVGILMVGRNINERKKAQAEKEKLEKQLQQAQKMETVGRLAGGVAHDFNNMLNVILGYADLAKMRLTASNPIYSDLLEIEKAAIRSRDLTAQLLAFSRKQIIAPRVVNLNSLIEETQKTITRLIGEDIDLRFYPAESLWNIKFDPVQAEQVLINLSLNARDAMPQGGKLVFETANITIDKTYRAVHPYIAPGEYVLLTVSDTGIGIDKEHIPYVFEPFFTTKAFGKGTGLGLATVYGITKQNNGFISVYSEPHQGSTFMIFLPRSGEAQPVKPAYPTPPPSLGSGTILLVEDDEMVLKMVADMLESLGYMVIASRNSLEALSLFEKGVTPIDLVITDVVMPGMSGKELCDKLWVTRPDLKVLFMSGYTANIIAQHGVLKEGMQFIQKPFSMNSLAEKVSKLISA